MTVYDQHGFRVLFHFAKDALPERPDVLVVVISMLSTAPQPIRNIVFQSAVPKVRQLMGLRSPDLAKVQFYFCRKGRLGGGSSAGLRMSCVAFRLAGTSSLTRL